jgi:prepilin-type N-terminal cleavage/methylation domain-containing protein
MKRRGGFSLMELLLAVAIFSVIALCLYSTFSGGIRIWRRQEEALRSSQGVRMALDAMSRELKGAMNYSAPKNNPSLSADLTAEKYPVFSGSDNTLAFVTAAAGKIEKVTYFFENSSGSAGALKKRVAFQADGFNEDTEKADTIISGVNAVLFEYAYTPEKAGDPLVWQNSWNQDKLPQDVRITLTMQPRQEKKGIFGQETKKKEEIFRKTIFIPVGIPGTVKTQ